MIELINIPTLTNAKNQKIPPLPRATKLPMRKDLHSAYILTSTTNMQTLIKTMEAHRKHPHEVVQCTARLHREPFCKEGDGRTKGISDQILEL